MALALFDGVFSSTILVYNHIRLKNLVRVRVRSNLNDDDDDDDDAKKRRRRKQIIIIK